MSQWTSSFSLIGPTGPVGPLKPAADYGSYLYFNSSDWIVGSTSVSLGTDAGATNQGSNSVAIGYKAGELNQPSGSIILNAGSTGLNGSDVGLYIKPIREVEPNYQHGLFYDVTTHEVIQNSVITLSSPNTLIVAASIIPDQTLAYTLGTSSLRYADVFIGPGSLHIGTNNTSTRIGTDEQGVIYVEGGLGTSFINIGNSNGGWRIGMTGTHGTESFDLMIHETGGTQQAGTMRSLFRNLPTATGPTGISGPTGPSGTTGPVGPTGPTPTSATTFFTSSMTISSFGGSEFVGPAFSGNRLNRRDIGYNDTVAEMNTGYAYFQVYDDLSTYSTLMNGFTDIYFSASNVYSSISYQFKVSNIVRKEPSPNFIFWEVWNPSVPKSGYIFPSGVHVNDRLRYGLSTFGQRPVMAKGLLSEFLSSSVIRAGNSEIGVLTTSTISVRSGVGIGITPSAYQLQLSSDSAAKPTTNTWTISSDERVKHNIVDADLDICYSTLRQIPLRYFEWDAGMFPQTVSQDRHSLGFIAQEIKPFFPKSVEIISVDNLHISTTTGILSTISDFHTLNVDQIFKANIGATQRIMKTMEGVVSTVISLNALVESQQSTIISLVSRL